MHPVLWRFAAASCVPGNLKRMRSVSFQKKVCNLGFFYLLQLVSPSRPAKVSVSSIDSLYSMILEEQCRATLQLFAVCFVSET